MENNSLQIEDPHIENWGTHQSQNVTRVTIGDGHACTASLITYGAVLQDLRVPDAKGQIDSITLGLNSIEDYVTHSPDMGVIAGRFANRIAFGRYNHKGQSIQLDVNSPPHHLHGGAKGIGKRVWNLEEVTDTSVTMSLKIHAFDDAYPGDLCVSCTYEFVDKARLQVRLNATVSDICPLNLAQHSYFNLDGEGSGSIWGQLLQIQADKVAIGDASNIPVHNLIVKGTPFDFQKTKPIDLALDNSFALKGTGLREVAKVIAPKSGRCMRLFSDQPELQVYTAHGLNVPVEGLGGRRYQAFDGLCLEPQVIPNAPNTADEDCFYGPERAYEQTIEYHFEAI